MHTKIRFYLLATFIPLFLGCGSRYTVPVEPVGNLDGQDKIDMAITLHLSNELCSLSRELEVGYGGVLEIKGDILCENAIRVANAAFSEVIVDRANNSSSKSADHLRPVLSPQFVDVENSIGMWTGSPNHMTITMEWPLNTSEGKLIWIDTVNGSAVVKGGTRFSHQEAVQRLLLLTLGDLFTKSYVSIISSIEIRNYANR